jgi:hypothetical protein
MFLAAATLIAMVGTAAVCLIIRQRVAAWLLLLFSAAWLPLNSAVEGPVIVRISDDHGITVADLLSIAGFVLAAAVLWSARPPAGSPRQRATSLLVASGIVLVGVVVAYQY